MLLLFNAKKQYMCCKCLIYKLLRCVVRSSNKMEKNFLNEFSRNDLIEPFRCRHFQPDSEF